MPDLGVETLAIVRATIGEVDARHSALTLSMWHHAGPDPRRDMVMADFACAGRPSSFARTFLCAAQARLDGAWPALRVPQGLSREHLPMLEQAFAGALADVLGSFARPMVVNAWTEVMRAFLHELARPLAD